MFKQIRASVSVLRLFLMKYLGPHLTLIAPLVLLSDRDQLQSPLAAPGRVEELEPLVSGESSQAVGEDLIVGQSDPGDGSVLYVGHAAVQTDGSSWKM